MAYKSRAAELIEKFTKVAVEEEENDTSKGKSKAAEGELDPEAKKILAYNKQHFPSLF